VTKAEFHKWVAQFIGRAGSELRNTPQQHPEEGVPHDTVLVTIDVRSVPREHIAKYLHATEDAGMTVVAIHLDVDGEPLNGRTDSCEFVTIIPPDESE
jgi:hypothetical protein